MYSVQHIKKKHAMHYIQDKPCFCRKYHVPHKESMVPVVQK